jgi:gp16 family phage-associated protein
MSNQLRSAADARRWFFIEGISMSDWAREHGFPRQAVYAVLSGRSRCTRGRGHSIAVALGMKSCAEAATRRDRLVSHDRGGPEAEPRAASGRGPTLGPSSLASSATEDVSP